MDKDDIQLSWNFAGYQDNSDITTVPMNALVPPSQNVLITGDVVKVIESRSGYKLLGRAGLQPAGFGGIRSKYDNFVNGVGIKLPNREYLQSTGLYTLEVFYLGDWQTIHSLSQFPHELYFTEWYDDDLSLPMLVWVGGHKSGGLSDINYWYGGISLVVSVTATTVTISDPIAQLGFTPAGTFWVGNNLFTYTGFTGNTFTGVTPNPVGVVVAGDVLTDGIRTTQLNNYGLNLTNIPSLDICATLDNHIFYGSYETRIAYVSNSQSARSLQEKTQTVTRLDDIVIVGNYTANIINDIKIEIVSIAPPLEIQEFISTGPNGLNDAFYDTTTGPYSGAPGVTNVYKTVIVADYTLLVPAGTAFAKGDVVVGNTTNAIGRLVDFVNNGPVDEWGIVLLSTDVFQTGETVVDQNNTAITATLSAAFAQNWVQNYKNQNIQSITSGLLTGTTLPLFGAPNQTITLVDGLTINFENYFGHSVGDTFQLTIRAGKPDQYKWYTLDATSGNFINPQGPFDINTAGSPLTDGTIFPGVSISWQTATDGFPYGHSVGDYWILHFVPEVTIPWSDVSFTLPLRKPGEGALVKLDSPPVFFKVQEEQLHANSRSGIITMLSFQQSADLLRETILATRIKTAGANKSLRQCLTVNTRNDIYYMNINNQLVSLGRVENINNSPMMELLSLPVKNEFFKTEFVVTKNGNGNARLDWGDNKVFISVPSAAKWYIYDEFYGFWQPPQTGNFSAISIINGQVCAHSAITDETYILFSASNDNGYPFKALAAFPYNSNGRRDRLKAVSELFTEGYKSENTNLYAKVNLEYGNCEGGPDVRLDPKVCVPETKASLGKSNFGKHGLANDPITGLAKFHHVLPFNEKFVSEHQTIYYSDSIDLYFRLVSTGTNAMLQDQRNVTMLKPAGTTEVPQFPGIPGTPKLDETLGGTNLPQSVADALSQGGGN